MVFALGGDIKTAEFANQKLVAVELLKYFLVSKKYIHIGVVTYGNDVKVINQFKYFANKKNIQKSIKLAASPTRGANLKEVLNTLLVMFLPENGAREYVQKSFVLFIDDKSVLKLPNYKYELNKLISNRIKPVIVLSGNKQIINVLPDWIKENLNVIHIGYGSGAIVDKIRAGLYCLPLFLLK